MTLSSGSSSGPPSGDQDRDRLARRARQARTIGLYTAIPTMMLVGPVLGWLLGRWAGGRWGHATTFETLGAILGLVAAARQVYLVFRRQAELEAADADRDGTDERRP